MKHVLIFESYTATLNKDYLPVVNEVPNLKGDYETIAKSYLDELKKEYNLGKGKPFNSKIGNDAWFAGDFFRWCEIARMPVQLIFFPETKKQKNAHIAIYMDGWVIDFTHKEFSKDEKEMVKVLKPEEYKKYGYDVAKADILDEFPNWVEDIYPPRKKK